MMSLRYNSTDVPPPALYYELYLFSNKQRESMRGGKTHIIGSCFNLLVEFVLVFIPERRVAHQENIQDHTYKSTGTHTHIQHTLIQGFL